MSTRAPRTTAEALLELGALDKRDWQKALQRILRIDAETLAVDRTSYWSFCNEPRMITCELGFIKAANAFEQGAVLNAKDAPVYLEQLQAAQVIQLDDVTHDPRSRELLDYCAARKITSMLDVPVWVESRLVGVLCHEHVGPPRHWTQPETDFVLSVTQCVAAALEAKRRAEAEAESERACLISHASLLVSRSLDLQEIADKAVHFTLPQLADWAAIDLVDDGAIKRLAIAHSDPKKKALIGEYAAQFPPRGSGPHPSVEANRLDQSVLIPQVTDDILQRHNFTAAHIEWLHKLGIRSAMAILIRVPDSIRAVLVLVSATRTYDFADLKLAEEFGERIGTALNNARLYRQATEALSARDEFLALAAHELRTPLTSLRVSCEHLLTQAADIGENTIVKPAQRILRQSRRLSRLVNRMLDASLAGRRAPPIYPDRVDLVALVREVVDELSKTHAPIETDLPASLFGHWDGDRLQQVIGNLLDNAVKYGRGQPVRLTLTADATQATLTVSDKGIGIDPDRLPHLFEPYERGESSRNYGGLGLGLFLSRQIVAAHGGTLRVRSQREIGSEFIVTLPLTGTPAK